MRKIVVKLSLVYVLLLSFTIKGFGQGEANIWYFGEKFGLDFNNTPPTVLTNGSNTSASAEGEGTSSICDASGNLLFYSDGANIYRGNHTSLTAVLSNRNISQNIIVPDPGTAGQYYFIHPWASDATSNLVQGIKYSIISATNSTDAAVVSLNVTFPGSVANISQAITVIPNNDNTGYWIVGHESNSTNFKVWPLTSGGIGAPTNYPIGFSAPVGNPIAMLKANSCSNRIAISYYFSQKVQVLSFDNSTGAVTGVTADIDNFETAGTYGVEFSPNGNHLFVSITGENTASEARLYQFRLDNGDPDLPANRYIVDNVAAPGSAHRNGAVQLGPDQKVYMSIFGDWGNNSGGVSVVNFPDIFGVGCDYDRLQYTNTSGAAWPTMGLPPVLRSFISKPATLDLDGVDISSSNRVCQGKSITMAISVLGGATNISWEISGVAAGTGASISHTFNTVGAAIPVEVTFDDDCGNTRVSNSTVQVMAIQKPTVTTPTTCTASSSAGVATVWYDALTGGNIVGTGSPFNPAAGLLPATFYAEDATPIDGPYTVGANSVTQQNTGFPKTGFTAHENIILASVDIRPFTYSGDFTGQTVTINLRNSGGALLNSKVHTLTGPGTSAAPQTVPLNFSVPAGSGYYLQWVGATSYTSDQKTTYTNSLITVTGDPDAGAVYNGNGPFYNFVVAQPNPCSERQSVDLTSCCSLPAQPSVITGDGTYCLNAETYTVTDDPAVDDYTWTASAGGTVTASTTNSVSITWTTTGAKTVTVTPENGCGSGMARTLDITVSTVPAQPSVITGDGVYCLNAETYSVIDDPLVDDYTWTASAGGTVTASTTNSVSIAWTTTGAKTVTVTPENGCGSGMARTLDITVTDVPAQPSLITGNATPCPGNGLSYGVTAVVGVDYAWTLPSGGSVTGTFENASVDWTTPGGPYTLTVTPSNGCGEGTERDLSVTVNSGTSATVSAIDGSNNHCKSDLLYNIVNDPLLTYKWTLSGGGNLSGTTGDNVSVDWTTAGTFTLTVTPENACGEGTPSTKIVTVNGNPTISNATLSQTICSGSASTAVTLTSDIIGTTFDWTATPSSVQITGHTASATDVTTIAAQTIDNAGTTQGSVSYLVTAEGPTGCPGTGSISYVINVDPEAVADVTTTSVQTCSATQILPGVSPPSGTVEWVRLSGDGIISNDAQFNSDVTGLAAGQSGTFQMTVTSGECSATSSVVTVARSSDETPSVTLSQPTSPVCEGTSVTFTATGVGGNSGTRTFEFINASTSAVLQAASTVNTYTVSPTSSLNVKVIMTANSSCLAPGATQTPESSAIVVMVIPATQTGLTVTGSQVCLGNDATVTIAASQLNVDYEGFIGATSVSNIVTGTGGDITLTIPASSLTLGANTITVQADGCSIQNLTQTATIDVVGLPIANAGPDISLTTYQDVNLDGTGSSSGNYTWTSSDPSAVISDAGILTPLVSVTSISTTFTLTVTSTAGGACSSEDEMNVILDLSVSIPNAFSPNGDGNHDLFEVKNAEFYPNAKMMIYNQWGLLIYESGGGYKEPWDGKKGNTSVDLGTYYYIFDLNQPGFKPMTGSVSIIK